MFRIHAITTTDEPGEEPYRTLTDASAHALACAQEDAAERDVAVVRDCMTCPEDLDAYGADEEGAPIYVVREVREVLS